MTKVGSQIDSISARTVYALFIAKQYFSFKPAPHIQGRLLLINKIPLLVIRTRSRYEKWHCPSIIITITDSVIQ